MKGLEIFVGLLVFAIGGMLYGMISTPRDGE
jgi:hypothetical protein